MASFTLREIMEATGGKLLAGKPGERVSGVSTDTRQIKKNQLFVAIKGDTFDGHDFLDQASAKGASAFVIHRQGVPVPLGKAVVVVEDTVKALGAIARHHRRRFDIPLIAITGSAGKTSTKELVADVMRQKYRVLFNKGTENNHIGVPMTLLKLTRRHEVAVIEMGTNHPGEIAYLARHVCPTCAVFTNVGASHLEGLGSLQGVFEEKAALLKSLPQDGCVVVNADDPYWAKLLKRRLPQRVISYAVHHQADVKAQDIVPVGGSIAFKVGRKYLFRVRSPSLAAVHNALAAIACGRFLRVADAKIQQAIFKSRPVKGRQCLIKAGGMTLIDDTYNANPVSYKNAILTLKMFQEPGRRVLVAADMLELGEHSDDLHRQVGEAAGQAGIDALFTCGHRAELIAAGARATCPQADVRSFASQRTLTGALKGYLRRGDVVLFKGSRGMRMEKVFSDIKVSVKG